MSEDDRRRGSAWPWVAAALAAPVLYVLSVGPVERVYRGTAPPPAVDALYAPLDWVHANVPAAQKPLDWYVDLWDR